ncbi:hypothetical protein [Lysinibacillus telephonicus]|uniref:hypothetical protein n=1 Tax=Lysinibacillus telephonicus TaxID=1714840 RepID=UPI0037D0BAC8
MKVNLNDSKVYVEVQNAKRLSELLQKAIDQLEQLEKTVDEIDKSKLRISVNSHEQKSNINTCLSKLLISSLGLSSEGLNSLNNVDKAFILASLQLEDNRKNN